MITSKRPSTLISFLTRSICLMLCLLGLCTWATRAAIAEDYDKQVLTDMDFTGKSLQGSQFNKTVLRRVKFIGSNLKGVSLFGADLTDADLSQANLSFATLDTARMDFSNLSNANLEGAFAYGTSFRKVNIDGADFTDVDLRDNVREALCEIAKGKNSVTGRDTRETLECE